MSNSLWEHTNQTPPPALRITHSDFERLAPAAHEGCQGIPRLLVERHGKPHNYYAAYLPVRAVRSLVENQLNESSAAELPLASNALILRLPDEFEEGAFELVSRTPDIREGRKENHEWISVYIAFRGKHSTELGGVEAWIEAVEFQRAVGFNVDGETVSPYWVPVIAITSSTVAIGGFVMEPMYLPCVLLSEHFANNPMEAYGLHPDGPEEGLEESYAIREQLYIQDARARADRLALQPLRTPRSELSQHLGDDFAIALDVIGIQVPHGKLPGYTNSALRKHLEYRHQSDPSNVTACPPALLMPYVEFQSVVPNVARVVEYGEFGRHSALIGPTAGVLSLVERQWTSAGAATPSLGREALVLSLPDEFGDGLAQLVQNGLDVFSLRDMDLNDAEIYGAFRWERPAQSDSMEVWIRWYGNLHRDLDRNLTQAPGKTFWQPVIAIAAGRVAVGGFFFGDWYRDFGRFVREGLWKVAPREQLFSQEEISRADELAHWVGRQPWRGRRFQCRDDLSAIALRVNHTLFGGVSPWPDEDAIPF